VKARGPRREAVFAIWVSIALATLALSAVGCGGSGSAPEGSDNGSTASTASTATRSATPAADSTTAPTAPPCRHVGVPKTESTGYRAPPQVLRKGEELTAVVRTSCGRFSISLDARRFPATVNSFVFLARHDFYDGMPFDKAGAGRYLHGGDPFGRAGGPGYSVKGRIPSGYFYRHGAVVMQQPGRRGEYKAGSQFFIVLAKPWLDMSTIYPPLGTVESGFGLLDRISQLGPHSRYPSNVGVLGTVGKLRRPVLIEDVAIERG
jgi:cyclophilin family peptidyl-prolyl cis-trans isomerase